MDERRPPLQRDRTARASGVGRKNPESPTAPRAQRPEVTLVERQDVPHAVPLGENHDGRVRESDPEVRMALENRERRRGVGRVEAFELVGAARDLGEKRRLSCDSDVLAEEVIEFRKHERRQE